MTVRETSIRFVCITQITLRNGYKITFKHVAKLLVEGVDRIRGEALELEQDGVRQPLPVDVVNEETKVSVLFLVHPEADAAVSHRRVAPDAVVCLHFKLGDHAVVKSWKFFSVKNVDL